MHPSIPIDLAPPVRKKKRKKARKQKGNKERQIQHGSITKGL
jgi:hypothetical protein